VNAESRDAVVLALVELAQSLDYRDRVDAGDALVNFVDDPRARRVLLAELAAGDDTAVTLRVAESLLRRLDEPGLSTVAVGLARANPNHADWIYTAIRNVFMIFARDRDAAIGICADLMRGTDSEVSRGAELMDSAISEIEPLLRPA
jgi:hypothetical protein